MIEPTPSQHPGQATRHADFGVIAEALDFAAQGPTGINFYSGKGALTEVLPYSVLRVQALDLARRMIAAGLEPGDRVGLVAESDGDFVRAFFACQYAALVPAPLPLPAAFGGKDSYISHLRRLIESADAVAVFVPTTLEKWLDDVVAGLDLKISGTLAPLYDIEPSTGELPSQDPEGLSYLQFSSGSTRFPLGIAVTQRAFMANASSISRDGLGIRDGDRAISWLPFYHDMGLVGFLLTPVTCQMSLDIIPTREFARRPLLWLNLISRNRCTVSFSPSFGYDLCVRRAETASTEGIDLSSWRSAGIGGDMIRPNVLTRFLERFAPIGFSAGAFVPSYGMAEATLGLSFMRPGQGALYDTIDVAVLETAQRAVPPSETTSRARTFIKCGYMLPGHDVEVRNEADAVLPDRHVGRIMVRGPSLMTCYFGAPEETARVLTDQGWLDTGDLGYLVDGQIVITGRAKDLIIVNGRNLWPQDLEWTAEAEVAALRSGDVAVFSVDGETDEEVVALVQCRTADPAARAALAVEISDIFRGRHGLNSNIVLVPPHSLPQTSSGKLSRSRARTMYLADAFSPLSVALPADAGAE